MGDARGSDGALQAASSRRLAQCQRTASRLARDRDHPSREDGDLLMYQAFGSRGSRVSRVLWMLEELGEPYEFVPVKLRSERAYALNPSGKVPILMDGDLKITDSAAICVYLADKHADKGLGANPGLAGRAEMDGWMHFAQSEFEAPLWNKLRHRFLLPPELRVDVGPAAAYDFANEVKALDGRLGDGDYALG